MPLQPVRTGPKRSAVSSTYDFTCFTGIAWIRKVSTDFAVAYAAISSASEIAHGLAYSARPKPSRIRGVRHSAERRDADVGEDLALEIRRYFIPDFSNWKDHDPFENGFKRLIGPRCPSPLTLPVAAVRPLGRRGILPTHAFRV
jgi:hypothetical protein